MKRTILFLVITGTIINLLGRSVEKANSKSSLAASFSSDLERKILAATFHLEIFNAEEKYYEEGLATLVRIQEQTLLVSHNHWSFLPVCSRAAILDAESHQLLTLDCRSFKSLILYSSRGTLVIQAPEGLSGTPAELGSLEDIRPDVPVLIAHQSSSESSRVEIISGQVQSVDAFHQNPAMRFALPDEGMIRKGDSGGGIWVNGKLVGNLWAYDHELKTGKYFIDFVQTPIAAVIPWQAILIVSAPGEISQDNLMEGSLKDNK